MSRRDGRRPPDGVAARSDRTRLMISTHPADTLAKLEQLRTELAELAFALESRGRVDAADVANSVSARLAELCDELDEASWPGSGDRGDRRS